MTHGLNTQSVISMEQRKCPLTNEGCWGSACALWMRYDRADGQAFEACTFVLSTVLQEQAIVEQIRTQASVDKNATEVARGTHTLVALARRAQGGFPSQRASALGLVEVLDEPAPARVLRTEVLDQESPHSPRPDSTSLG